MNNFNNNIQYIIINNDYFDIKKVCKIKNIFTNIKYFIIDYETETSLNIDENEIKKFNATDENDDSHENNIVIEIDFNEFDDEINMNYTLPTIEYNTKEHDESTTELIKTFNEQFVTDDTKLIKNITKKEIVNYDNFTYNFNEKKKEEKQTNQKLKKIEENDTSQNELEPEDSFEMFNMINKSKQTLEEQKMFQMFQMNEMFNDILINDKLNVKKVEKDKLTTEMDEFIENCIIKASLKYNIEKKLHIIDINKLSNLIKTYKEIIDTSKKTGLIYQKKINMHTHTIYYNQIIQWYEFSYRGLNKIDANNKDLKFCIENLKNKDKYRKKNAKYVMRLLKLNYLVNNVETVFYYTYKEKI